MQNKRRDEKLYFGCPFAVAQGSGNLYLIAILLAEGSENPRCMGEGVQNYRTGQKMFWAGGVSF